MLAAIMDVVWFKRDLRIGDHAPLWEASQRGECLCLYVYEPEWVASDEFDVSQLQFINESLEELRNSLRRIGGQLILRVGRVPEVLEQLHQRRSIQRLWSHEETGNRLTFDRDLAVKDWCGSNNVPWTELPQTGVVRRLKSRDGWAKQREQFMRRPIAPTPERIVAAVGFEEEPLRGPEFFELQCSPKKSLQKGGESRASKTLESFLIDRGEDYSRQMSSPVTAPDACSRISPYLTWGSISMKSVMQRLHAQQQKLRDEKADGQATGNWLKSLKSFESRLSWHCHFMQKLEDEPEIEFRNMSRVYDGLRESEFDQQRFQAWCDGQTGYPMVDACMRALHQHSWINFRMRAMLVSFASYHLWLHWRPTAVYLAQHFLDFEPGIHFSQFQMQSGTTGINTVRIYSPIKQVTDHDPQGEFIREYVPELAEVPDEYMAEPHKIPPILQMEIGCVIGRDYPAPIVDHKTAYRLAKDRVFELRKQSTAREEAARVVKKHGSRKRTSDRR